MQEPVWVRLSRSVPAGSVRIRPSGPPGSCSAPEKGTAHFLPTLNTQQAAILAREPVKCGGLSGNMERNEPPPCSASVSSRCSRSGLHKPSWRHKPKEQFKTSRIFKIRFQTLEEKKTTQMNKKRLFKLFITVNNVLL